MEAAIDRKMELQSVPDRIDLEDPSVLVKRRLNEDRLYRFYFRDVACHYQDGILTLRGRLPTFYLKQVLQTMLRDVDGVVEIDNQVDVISAMGVSSVRAR